MLDEKLVKNGIDLNESYIKRRIYGMGDIIVP
jgi:hypothetical protein